MTGTGPGPTTVGANGDWPCCGGKERQEGKKIYGMDGGVSATSLCRPNARQAQLYGVPGTCGTLRYYFVPW